MTQARKASRRAISLVEIMVGVAVAGFALLPIAGYFVSLQSTGESEEGDTEAISMAANILESVISPSVPFDAIKPDGVGEDTAPSTGSLTKACGGTVVQAAFKGGQYERLVSDSVVGADRIKRTKKGVEYRVYFYAGKYYDRDDKDGISNVDFRGAAPATPIKVPHADNELTFSYLPGPYGDMAPTVFWKIDPTVASDCANKIILPATNSQLLGKTGFFTCPYKLMSFDKMSGAWNKTVSDSNRNAPDGEGGKANWVYNDQDNYFRVPGWPTPPSGFAYGYKVRQVIGTEEGRVALRRSLYQVARRVSGTSQSTLGYHPVTTDQGQFMGKAVGATGERSAALMKVVVGVKYKLHNFRSTPQGASSEREYWLMSLKAKLES